MVGSQSPYDPSARYRVIRIAGQPVLATPARPLRLRLAGISRYQPSTPRRTLFRLAAYVAAITGIDRLIGFEQASPISPEVGFDFGGWLLEVRQKFGSPEAVASVIWPPEAERSRLYVHVMNPTGAPIAFCKVSLDAANDANLADEADALDALGRLGLERSEMPPVVLRGSFGDRRYVAYPPLPEGGVPFSGGWVELSAIVDEFGGAESRLSARALPDLAWWRRFTGIRAQCSSAFLETVDRAVADGVRARRVHGDFTFANIMRVGPRIWLCDWEFSSATGPYWTDRIAFYISRHHRDCLARPGVALDAMLRSLAAESGTTAAEVAIALAFLCGCGNQAARSLARCWEAGSELPAAD